MLLPASFYLSIKKLGIFASTIYHLSKALLNMQKTLLLYFYQFLIPENGYQTKAPQSKAPKIHSQKRPSQTVHEIC